MDNFRVLLDVYETWMTPLRLRCLGVHRFLGKDSPWPHCGLKNWGNLFTGQKEGDILCLQTKHPDLIGQANLTLRVKLAFYILGASMTSEAIARPMIKALQSGASHALPGEENSCKDVMLWVCCGNSVAWNPKKRTLTAKSNFEIGIPRRRQLHKKFSISSCKKVLSRGELWEFADQVARILNPVVERFTALMFLYYFPKDRPLKGRQLNLWM